jgi:hypothetical protein
MYLIHRDHEPKRAINSNLKIIKRFREYRRIMEKKSPLNLIFSLLLFFSKFLAIDYNFLVMI